MPPQPPHRKRPASARQLQLSTPLKSPLAVVTTPPGPVQDSRKWQAGRGSVLPQPDTDLVVLQEGTSSLLQVPGTVAPPTEAPIQVPGTAAPPTEAPVQVRLSSHSFQLHPALGHGAETKSAAILPYAGGPVLCPELGCGLTPGEAREGGCSTGVDSSHRPDFFHVAVWLP